MILDVREVLRRILAEENDRAIARDLGIARKTVARYRSIAQEQRRMLEDHALHSGRCAERPASLEQPDLVAVATRVPRGVVRLISALAFHELTTHIPPSINVAFTSGIVTRTIDETEVKVYSPEKSIADAFKYRNKRGLDVALEVLS